MICARPSRESAAQLAAEIASDPAERAVLESIPRDVSPARPPKGKTFFPAQTEAEIAQGLQGDTKDPEISLRGLIARIGLLESQMQRLVREVNRLTKERGAK